MMVDWIKILETRGVEFVERGPNVVRGNIAVKCPLCVDDPSEHLNLMPGGGWFCMRNRNHRGRNPTRILSALLHCSYEQAARIIGGPRYIPDDFLARVQSELSDSTPTLEHKKLKLWPEFKKFTDLPSARPYVRYLRSRGLHLIDAQDFNLRYATTGLFRGRIIFPVWFKGKLVGWTGRSIWPTETLRYRALGVEEGAHGPISHYLLWYDQLMKSEAETICLTEGPFDAFKVRVLGERYGVTATCFFTGMPTREQVYLLYELLPRFRYRYVLLDRGTSPIGLRVASFIPSLNIGLKTLLEVKDPAELSTWRGLQKILG